MNVRLNIIIYISLLLSSIIIPIFLIFDFNSFSFFFVKDMGNQDVIFNETWYTGKLIIFPLSFLIIGLISIIFVFDPIFLKEVFKNKIFILILIYSLFLISYSIFIKNFIPIRNIKSLICINYIIYLFMLFDYIFRKFSMSRGTVIFGINLILLIFIIGKFVNYAFYLLPYKFYFNTFANYQFDTYFIYALFITSLFNFQLICKNNDMNKNLYFLFNGLLHLIFFIYIATNHNISAFGTLISTIIIFIFINVFKSNNIADFIFFNLIFINILVILILVSDPYVNNFYGNFYPLDERSRIFYRFLEGFQIKSLLGFIGSEYKFYADGAAHNDILEIFTTLGIGAVMYYLFIYQKINQIFNKKIIYSGMISLIFVGGLSQNNLMSIYLLPLISLTFILFKNN